MLHLSVDQERCIQCGVCVDDCIVGALGMENGLPVVVKEAACIGCQHCLTVCPTAALSILGKNPDQSDTVNALLPDFEQMRALVRHRRSVRHYKQEEVAPEVIETLIRAACYAPTGVNDHRVRFTVVKTRAAMARLREEIVVRLEELAARNAIPEGRAGAYLRGTIRLWREQGQDLVFRGAPHLLLASAPVDAPCGPQDCCIALSYFELLAQSHGLGTVWDGIFMIMLAKLSDLAGRLGLPEGHVPGYAMVFGLPAVQYHRVPQREPAGLHWVE